ncbi:hypothetical protein KZZ52_00420 [Dactylosporangium sp. AC04546]|uniref:hypothetical protein n=1 Tax=Dactylosporangium sp. AC04546 TaxID=2862460 RepID=UPI001EE0EED0|nr:hypothetical protein [Dactylosporangium sp. AC04546]WVK83954.1 hypothetical protein KZZ52_00420 [Dactylosporangium sp. AC04546]
MSIDQDIADDVAPDCTVEFDERSGCGVNVEYTDRGRTPFVALSFHTYFGESGVHDLTLAQVDQLRAALDAVSRAAQAFRPLPAA